MKKFTLTIGIPAYNEEQNIAHLLHQVNEQILQGITLVKIIVVSDASTDATVEQVRKTGIKKITLFENRKRQGVAYGLNTILKAAHTDIVVLLNADIQLTQKDFLMRLVKPIVNDSADLVSCKILSLSPSSFVSRVLQISIEMKRRMFESFRNGDNVYTCHGRARALSKQLAQKIRFPTSIGEDPYSYLYAKQNGFTYRYVESASIQYVLPASFNDHFGQSSRFFASREKMNELFGKDVVDRAYNIPSSLLLRTLLRFAWLFPLEMCTYVSILSYVRIMARFKNQTKDTWDIALSSKTLSAK